jgi:D-beta-D-heptose 7-phosphate kinase/D-beta-D-heptose 1-phosphate adenosyltransferase
MLAALRCVDEIVSFDGEKGLAELLSRRRPEVLAKGADYAGRPITGADLVGRVELLPLLPGSTTSTIERLRA